MIGNKKYFLKKSFNYNENKEISIIQVRTKEKNY
jgi:hypothetical protein